MGKLIAHLRRYLLLVANQELKPDLRRKVGPSDLVQETFVQLQDRIGQFRGGTEQELRAWLRKILINRIHDEERRFQAGVRNVSREQPLAGDSAAGILPSEPQAVSPGPRSNAIQREVSEELQAAINQLPAEYREVLRLKTWERLSYVEIGQRMNKSPDAVRMLWNRAFQRLRRQVVEKENERP
jgi:RNA polymerase sigma-70 factor (ECF subfamily)